MHFDFLPKVTHNEDAIREHERQESRRIRRWLKTPCYRLALYPADRLALLSLAIAPSTNPLISSFIIHNSSSSFHASNRL